MGVIFDSLIIILSSSLGLITLGFITGFSPVLYVAQVAAAAKSKTPKFAMRSLILGVLVGVIVAGLLFRFFQPGTLALFFNTAFGPIIVSSWFHVLLGVIFIIAGLWMLITKPRPIKPATTSSPATGWMLFSAGFLRTVFSASGMVALFFATQIIATTSGGPVTALILILIFLVATLFPFAVLYVLWDKSPESLEKKAQEATARLEKLPYRQTAAVISTGAGILILSSAIIGL